MRFPLRFLLSIALAALPIGAPALAQAQPSATERGITNDARTDSAEQAGPGADAVPFDASSAPAPDCEAVRPELRWLVRGTFCGWDEAATDVEDAPAAQLQLVRHLIESTWTPARAALRGVPDLHLALLEARAERAREDIARFEQARTARSVLEVEADLAALDARGDESTAAAHALRAELALARTLDREREALQWRLASALVELELARVETELADRPNGGHALVAVRVDVSERFPETGDDFLRTRILPLAPAFSALALRLVIGPWVGAEARPEQDVQVYRWIILESARSVGGLSPEQFSPLFGSDQVHTVQTQNGYHASVFGPIPEEQVRPLLADLKSGRLVPRDSFIATGRSFRP